MAGRKHECREHLLPYSSLYYIVLIAVLFCLTSLLIWSNFVGETMVVTESSSSSTLKHTILANITDFPIRSNVLPRDEWPKLDNQTCLEEGLPEYPIEGILQRRMPFAIVIGSMKSGTSALSIYLYQHPHVVKPEKKELHFFDFQYEYLASSDGIHRRETRKEYRRTFERKLGPESMQLLQNNSHMVAIDDSPRYIFWSDRVPARVLCVAPWAKIVAILRNPIDRAYSHYNMKRNSRGAKRLKGQNLPTFEEWVAMDIQLLKETGVVQNKIPQDEFAGSDEEMEAWKDYTRRGKHAPLGRGLYAIQLRHWFQAYEKAGKSQSDFFIIQSERMRADKSGVYGELLVFLDLQPHELELEREPNAGKYETEMSKETRDILEDFYKPYNQELYKLLGKEWKGAWDP